MRTDDFRDSLDALAGADPSVDDGLARVTKKVRTHRTRKWSAVATACVVVIAAATVGVVRDDDSNSRITLGMPTQPPGNVADFTWKRVLAPKMTIVRIVTADGKTFAVGSSPDTRPVIRELDANGGTEHTVYPAADATRFSVAAPPDGTVNDVVAFHGVLVAAGGSSSSTSGWGAVWRSTDGGSTWKQANVVPAVPDDFVPAMQRLVVSDGVLYAFGAQVSECPGVWMSTDGITFRFAPSPTRCNGPFDAATGPNGVVITSEDATAWTRSGDKWTAHRIPTDGRDPRAGIGAIAGDDHGYVVVGSFASPTYGAAIWWSPDGKTWKHVLTARGDAPRDTWAVFTGVAHSSAGWIAVGARGHRSAGPKMSDAMVWTSSDGEHWTESRRDDKHFEQYARVVGVGPTTSGFGMFGFANMTEPGTPSSSGVRGDGIVTDDDVLWIGSSAPATTGMIEGSMRRSGGLAPGTSVPIAGTVTVKSAAGDTRNAIVDAAGAFSIDLAPGGDYSIVGHSPLYGSGKYTCHGNDPGPVGVRANHVTRVDLTCQVR